MKSLIFIFVIAIIMACGGVQKEEATSEKKQEQQQTIPDKKFDDFKNQFVENLWKLEPIWASYEGFHQYDSLLLLPTEKQRKNKLNFITHTRNELKAFDPVNLSVLNQIDYKMINDALGRLEFELLQLKSFEWNPAQYNLGGAFFKVLDYRKKPISWRLEQLDKKLDKVPAYYAAAKAELKNPTKVHTVLAIEQLNGSISIFKESMLDSLKQANFNPEFKKAFKMKSEKAAEAIKDFTSYLEEKILPQLENDTASFRLGKALFEQKFKHEIQSSYSAEEIFHAAVKEKSILHDRMYRLSEMLWKKYYDSTAMPGNRLETIQMIIDTVSSNHVSRDSFIYAIRQQIPQLAEFVKAHDLLSLDDEKPLVVRETPEYMRGVAGASISASGPYDKDAETYYNVSPLDDYEAAAAESYLREYNHYVLQILNIHEAIPGHYTQLIYSNKSPSIIKSIFGNGAMIEGWAVYAEKMMLENNYGGSEKEMGLMYYKWNLRTVCNAILDYGVHVNNFNKKEAMQLLRKEAFQEKSEAEGKWRRARLSQVQLSSYFTGYYEIMQLRDSMRSIAADDFNLKHFHETFLSFGSAPVKYIGQAMRGELTQKK